MASMGKGFCFVEKGCRSPAVKWFLFTTPLLSFVIFIVQIFVGTVNIQRKSLKAFRYTYSNATNIGRVRILLSTENLSFAERSVKQNNTQHTTTYSIHVLPSGSHKCCTWKFDKRLHESWIKHLQLNGQQTAPDIRCNVSWHCRRLAVRDRYVICWLSILR